VLLRADLNVPVKIGAVTEAACTGANDSRAG
jgi:3-phosphoglycerate kinase